MITLIFKTPMISRNEYCKVIYQWLWIFMRRMHFILDYISCRHFWVLTIFISWYVCVGNVFFLSWLTCRWCGPCKMLAPRLESVLNEYHGKIHLAKVDIDENSDLALEYGVSKLHLRWQPKVVRDFQETSAKNFLKRDSNHSWEKMFEVSYPVAAVYFGW